MSNTPGSFDEFLAQSGRIVQDKIAKSKRKNETTEKNPITLTILDSEIEAELETCNDGTRHFAKITSQPQFSAPLTAQGEGDSLDDAIADAREKFERHFQDNA